MTISNTKSREARIQAEVERSVARYEGVAPPFMLAKLRELAERYWREHPQASRALDLLDQRERARSGTEVKGDAGDEGAGAALAGADAGGAGNKRRA